jgi:hypothetical protein
LTEQDHKEEILMRLKHSIQMLALPADLQLDLLPSYVSKADALALEFDQWREVALHNYRDDFTSFQLSSLLALDAKLGSHTTDTEDRWTVEAIRKFRDWQEIRSLASQTLETFGWPHDVPPSHSDEYIPEDRMKKDTAN